MESISDTQWDVVISGTGLPQSLLALALSRSDKNILHVDPHDYYGGSEAAFGLQEAEEWAERHRAVDRGQVFAAAEVKREGEGLASHRSYNLALAPQLIHARSRLLSQLVDSKAFRQIEFLAVGSFYIYQPSSESSAAPLLSRIPSTREDVFTNTSIPARAKRALMKFLKFVLDFKSESQVDIWQPHAEKLLTEFLASEFKLDGALQAYIITLTLSEDGKVCVKDGLATIHRHLTSMGAFGSGFAAVYPKWGGLSEVAQVGCRAAAVGGAIYMLGTGVKEVVKTETTNESTDAQLCISLTNDVQVKSQLLVQNSAAIDIEASRTSRVIAITSANLSQVFATVAEGSPTPAVAIIAFPPGSILMDDAASMAPIYAMVHSSDTGECPPGQYVVYLSTVCTSTSKTVLEKALRCLTAVVGSNEDDSKCLYQLYYEQSGGTSALQVDDNILTLMSPSLDLAFNDQILEPVQEAWKVIMGNTAAEADVEYMKFQDREGQDEDDFYD